MEDLRDTLSKLVEYALNKGAEFADIRVERAEITYLELENGILKTTKSGFESGASIRVLYRGCWGFSICSELSFESIRRSVDIALAAARALASRTSCGRKVVELSALRDDYRDTVSLDPTSISIETKIADLRSLHSEIAGDSRVRYVGIRYMDTAVTKLYVSSDGRDIRQDLVFTWLYVWATAREGDIVASVREELGTRDGYTIWSRWPQHSIAEKVLNRLSKQLKAKPPKGGVYPAVLAPEIVGVFVHEAFGHLAEADLTLSGSAIKDRIGTKIASDVVTIVDDPMIDNGFGNIRYDDEGVYTRRAILIERGIVRELMVDRERAAILNQEPTGNARAESYRVPPLIRMRNTYMVPGSYSVEELLEDIDFGYYLVSFRGGQANLDGTFQVGVQEAYEIVNGEIRDPVRNLSISGNTLETLAQVDAVAKDFSLGAGRCGKGQMAFVSDGGPHIRVRKIVIGGQAG